MTTSLRFAELKRASEVFLEVARDAAKLLHAGYRSHPVAEHKTKKDLVTEFDRRSQDLILKKLSQAFPGVITFAEEDAPEKIALPQGLCFAVDPLDGTTNFVHGHPFYCVSIGALEDGHPVAGAIVAPSLDLEWQAVHAGGTGKFALRSGRPMQVTETTDLGEALIATGFPPEREHAPENNFDSFIRVKKKARAVRRCGSAAIDLAFVADGTYDGYWERRLLVWDCAAAGAMVLAAGGRITAIGGGEPRYERGHIVATNGRIHEQLSSAVDGD